MTALSNGSPVNTQRSWVTATMPRVIAHRGASQAAPENTLAAIREAHAQGARWVEVDVKLSGDGVPYLMHDAILDRTTDGLGSAKGTHWHALATLDAGRWFAPRFAGEKLARLSDALELLRELGMGINLELKPFPDEEETTALTVVEAVRGLESSGAPPPLISSFSKKALAAAQRAAPEIPRGLLVARAASSTLHHVKELDCATLHLNASLCRMQWLRRISRTGLPVLCYTVNDPTRAQRLLEAGAHAVFTDIPAQMTAALRGKGLIS